MKEPIQDYAEYLASEAETENAAVHEFIASYQNGDEVHVFMEGEEDIAFYLPEIRRLAGKKRIFSYNCGGKWNVVDARDFIESSYDVLALFFVDKDYDDLLGRQAAVSSALYITDVYSIENWLSSEQAMDIVFEDILAIPAREASAIKRRALDTQKQVMSRMYLLAAWILAAKDAACNPNLNNTNSMNSLLSVSSSREIRFEKNSFAEFKRRVDSGGGSPSIGLQIKWYRRIKKCNFEAICRGKYHAWIFCKSIRLAIEEENVRRKAAKRRQIRTPEALMGARVVDLLAGRMPYAPSVVAFLSGKLN